jgi:hypothetical protein
MKQLISVLLFTLLLPSLTFAQSNFKPALVVTTAGDTLRGAIDYREWDLNPKAVTFRNATNGNAEQQYTPKTARYIEITGMEAFQSYEGAISMDQVDKDNLVMGKADTRVATDALFLNILQQGDKVTLYRYKDEWKERFFIRLRGEENLQELSYRRYYKASNSSQMVTQRYYIGQLLNVARHHGTLTNKLQREIEAAAYTEHDLLRVVSKLNGLSEEDTRLESKGKISSRLFAGVALSRSTMSVYGDDPFAQADEHPVSYWPRLTVGNDIFLNSNVQKLFFRIEASLTSADFKHKTTWPTGGGGYDEMFYYVAQHTVSLSPQVLYNFYNRPDFKVYAGAGLALNYSLYEKNYSTTQHFYPKLNMEGKVYGNKDYRILQPIWASYTLRAGITLRNRYEVTAMYLAPGTITRYTSREYKTGSTNIGVNYLFGK